ncbi:MAG TPA: hypothetical protein VMV78_07570 [Thiobacillus sp.]|nr:hypothetical protein [Thiobacillus sp.]
MTESIKVPLPPPETAGQLPMYFQRWQIPCGAGAEAMDQRLLIDNVCFGGI